MVVILSDEIIVDNQWSIPSTFLQQTVKQLEIVWEVVLPESKLNDVKVMNKK